MLTAASKDWGFGHLARTAALAMVAGQRFEVSLLVNDDQPARIFLQNRGLPCQLWQPGNLSETLRYSLQETPLPILVVDLPALLFADILPVLRVFPRLKTVFIDYQTAAFRPQLTIIPALEVAQLPVLLHPNSYRGRDWLILNPALADRQVHTSAVEAPILVAAGGSVHGLESLWPMLAEVSQVHALLFLVGPYVDAWQMRQRLQAAGISNYTLVQAPPEVFAVYASCKAALLTFGVTAYETIALGIPTGILNVRHTEDLTIVAELVRHGACASLLGVDSAAAVLQAVQQLLSGALQRDKPYIDGQGCQRICQQLNALL